MDNKNIAYSRLEEIANQTQDMITDINKSIEWSKENLREEQVDKAAYDLKASRRKLKKIKKAVTSNTTIAVFGASQQGKSYLVKNMLCDENSVLKIPDKGNNKNYDFISHINPPGGGAEATGLVTRFTYESELGNCPPIKIRLLNPAEIITIITDSYFSDFKIRKNDIKAEDVKRLVEKLPDFYSPKQQDVFTDDDVYSIEEYLKDVYYKTNLQHKLDAYYDANYWNVLANNIQKIDPKNWVRVFEILWGNQERLSSLFVELLNGLKNVGFSKVIYTDFEAVLVPKTILDVTRLKELTSAYKGDLLKVETSDKKEFTIGRNVLSAIASELILNISDDIYEKKGNEFLKDVDLLDFPGSRTRLELIEGEELTDDDVTGMLLRGKVAYLFNTYSLNYEISNLLLCTGNTQSNVRSVPALVDKWINYNIGETPEKRSKVLSGASVPPLFVILTMWNCQLDYDKDKGEDIEYKWKHRFDKLLGDEVFGSYDWAKSWLPETSFKNYYLLRDFKYSKDTFTGFEKNSVESGVDPEREEFYKEMKKSFRSSPLVKQFFNQPEDIWEKTSVPTVDGSRLIINSLAQSANNRTRSYRYSAILKEQKNDVTELLKRYYHDDDDAENIKKAVETGSSIHATADCVFGIDAIHFGEFIELFLITESEVYNLYHDLYASLTLADDNKINKYILIRDSALKHGGLSTDKSYDNNLQTLLRTYNCQDETRLAQLIKVDDFNDLFYGEMHQMKNRSQALAEHARDYWFDNSLNIKRFEKFVDLGFDKALLTDLIDNFKSQYDQLGLTKMIALRIREYVDKIKNINEAEYMVAHITSGIINDYVTSLGWSYYSEDKKQKIKSLNIDHNLNLIVPEDEVIKSLSPEDYFRICESMENMNDILNERPTDNEKIKIIPMIANYRKWRELIKISFISGFDNIDYDIEANAMLGSILDNIKLYNFTIS